MNPMRLQRAIVLLHHDARFAADFFGPGLLPTPLSPEERALLLRADPRAFRTDPERPLRLLAALLEEFPVSCALLESPGAAPWRGQDAQRDPAGRPPAQAWLAFPSSREFREAIWRGGSFFRAFAAWLAPHVGPFARLEEALACVRRRFSRPGQGIARASHVEVLAVPTGTLSAYAAARAQLGATPHEAAARGIAVSLPPPGPGGEFVLVAAEGEQGPTLSPCSEALHDLLAGGDEARPREAWVAQARALGAGDDAPALIDDLLEEGLLSAAP